MEGIQKVETLIQYAREVKAENIVLLNVSEYSNLADYVMVCEGRSPVHCRGIAERIELQMKKEQCLVSGIEGKLEGSWILMDYQDVIVHIFHPEIRAYYNLEKLHAGCPAQYWNDEDS